MDTGDEDSNPEVIIKQEIADANCSRENREKDIHSSKGTGASGDEFAGLCYKTSPFEDIPFLKVVDLLTNFEEHLCEIAPEKAIGGEAYLFNTLTNEEWDKDGHIWSRPEVESLINKDSVLTKKTQLIGQDANTFSTAFQRVTYALSERPDVVLVHYMGDEKYQRGRNREQKRQLPVPDDDSQEAETSAARKKRIARMRTVTNKASSAADMPEEGEPLDLEEALEMLNNYEGRISTQKPIRPAGGEIYYFDCTVMGDSWKDDGYYWRNSGKRAVPKKEPVFWKTYYMVRLNNMTREGTREFQRYVFRLISRPHIVLVQYVGNESVVREAVCKYSRMPPVASAGQYSGAQQLAAMAHTAEELANPPTPILVAEPGAQLPLNNVIQILEEHHPSHICKTRPFKPKAGEAYLIVSKGSMRDIWKQDGYEWIFLSPTYHPRNKPILCKRICFLKTPDAPKGNKDFQKVIYCLVKKTKVILVHYSGDEALADGPQSAAAKATSRKRSAETDKDEEAAGDAKRLREDPMTSESLQDVGNQLHTELPPIAEDDDLSIKNRSLRLTEAVDILKNYEGNISMSRAIKPKAGEIYLFDTTIVGDDWKCDNYMWRNSGTIYQPKSNPIVKKSFNSIRLDETKREGSKVFQKTIYSLLEQPNIIMVHYSGDETVYTPLKHGNRKRGYQEYQRTAPSVLNSIRKAIVDTSMGTPKTTMKHINMTAPLHEPPRDLDQIRNAKRLLLKTNQPSESQGTDLHMGQPQITPGFEQAVNEVILFEQDHQQEQQEQQQHQDEQHVILMNLDQEQTSLDVAGRVGVSYMQQPDGLYVVEDEQQSIELTPAVLDDNVVVLETDEIEEVHSDEEDQTNDSGHDRPLDQVESISQPQDHENNSIEEQIDISQAHVQENIYEGEDEDVKPSPTTLIDLQQHKQQNVENIKEQLETEEAQVESVTNTQTTANNVAVLQTNIEQSSSVQTFSSPSTSVSASPVLVSPAPAEKAVIIPAPGISTDYTTDNGNYDKTIISPLKTALLNKAASEQTIVLQALDPRPEVCKVQLEILNLQKRNLELQEAKLKLEIKRLQQSESQSSIKDVKVENEPKTVNQQNITDNQIYIENQPDNVDNRQFLHLGNNQNIIYIQDPGLVEAGGEQVIYVEDPAFI